MKKLFIISMITLLSMHHTAAITQKNTIQQKTITILIPGTIVFGMSRSIKCQKLGLIPMPNISNKYMEKLDAIALCKSNPQHYQLENFYFFGWGGAHDAKVRRKQAINLYNQLEKLLKKKNNPKIRIITMSYGGEIALEMERTRRTAEKRTDYNNFIIDELILLCSPIGEHAEAFASSPFFKKIYHLYSIKDSLQTGDWKEYTKRIFSPENKALKEKLRQVDIGVKTNFSFIKRFGFIHIEFCMPAFMEKLPAILKKLDTLPDSTPTIEWIQGGQLARIKSFFSLGSDILKARKKEKKLKGYIS